MNESWRRNCGTCIDQNTASILENRTHHSFETWNSMKHFNCMTQQHSNGCQPSSHRIIKRWKQNKNWMGEKRFIVIILTPAFCGWSATHSLLRSPFGFYTWATLTHALFSINLMGYECVGFFSERAPRSPFHKSHIINLTGMDSVTFTYQFNTVQICPAWDQTGTN